MIRTLVLAALLLACTGCEFHRHYHPHPVPVVVPVPVHPRHPHHPR